MNRVPVFGWTRTARLLHWGIAAAILIEVPAGFTMAWTYGSKFADTQAVHLRASQAHHTIGMLVLLAFLVRLYWRSRHPAPPLPHTIPAPQRWVARGVQALLYALLLFVPLTGWAALSSMAAGGGYPAPPMWFFGHNGFGPSGLIPRIVTPVPWNAPGLLTYGHLAKAHVWLLILGGTALALHIAGALYHHFIKHDGVLRRMLSSRGARTQC